jgi:hypothetical protein
VAYGGSVASTKGQVEDHVAPQDSAPQRVGRAAVIGRVVLGYAIASSIVPLDPAMPEIGLDASWRVAINRATADGLQFGHDIVFTYGPYGGVLSGVYEPGIRSLMLAAALVLAAGYVSATLLTLRRASVAIHVFAAVAVLVLTSNGLDGLVLLYPLFVVSAIPNLPAQRGVRTLLVLTLAAPLGLLPIMKLSVVPTVAAGLVAAGVLLLRRRDWSALAVLTVTPAATLVIAWAVAHQSIPGLVDYARNSWFVVAGYSEAMSVHESSRLPSGAGTATYLLTAAILLVAALTARRDLDALAETGMVAVTLFLAFKAGFVRADGHMQGGALALLGAGAIVVVQGLRGHTIQRRLVAACVLLGAAVCWFSIPVDNPLTAVGDKTIGLASHVVQGDVSSASLRHSYDAAMASIRRQATLPEAKGTSDLYTSSLNLLFAQGARWDPRPVIQSYSAYTPELERLNARHLTGPDAPRTVFFQVGPIDGRLPALEDGASWLPLIENYDVRPDSGAYLVLRRRTTPRRAEVGLHNQVVHARFGEVVDVPSTSGAWLASFDVRDTMAGKLRNALWKAPQLRIEVTLADGRTASHRFIPGMARSAFILSPYVSDTAGLRALFPDQPAPSPRLTVTSIKLLADSAGARFFWHESYALTLRSVDVEGSP